MKKVFLFVLILSASLAKGQIYQPIPGYGFSWNRGSFVQSLFIPEFSSPALNSNISSRPAIGFQTGDISHIWLYDPASATWNPIGGGATGFTNANGFTGTITGGNLSINTTVSSNQIFYSVSGHPTGDPQFYYCQSCNTGQVNLINSGGLGPEVGFRYIGSDVGFERDEVANDYSGGASSASAGYRVQILATGKETQLYQGTASNSFVPNAVMLRTTSDFMKLHVDNGTTGYIGFNIGALGAPATNEKMRITKDGRLGIGTTTPATALHVVGNPTFVTGSQAVGFILQSDATGKGEWVDPTTITSGDDLQTVTDNGNTTTNDITVANAVSGGAGFHVRYGAAESLSFHSDATGGSGFITITNDPLGVNATVSLDPTLLTANRNLQFPDAGGIIATQAYVTAAVAGGAGEANTASNLGGGLANWDSKSGVDLRFNSFLASDFNLASHLISIDYVNGQAATASLNGFLSSTDWTTFNNKLSTNWATGNQTVTANRAHNLNGFTVDMQASGVSMFSVGPSFVTAAHNTIGFSDLGSTTSLISVTKGLSSALSLSAVGIGSGSTELRWPDISAYSGALATFVTKVNGTVAGTDGALTITTVSGNAGTATALANARTISATGDVTWTSASFDGTANVSGSATVTKINGTSLGGLATGILKNTTTTGIPSIAIAADFPTLNQSTTGSAATLTTPRNIYGNPFDGSAALTQIIAPAFGGTNNGFFGVTGPASTTKTFTFPNASATVLTDNALVTVGQGGTGVGTLTGIVKGNGTSAFTAAAAGTDYVVPSGSVATLTTPRNIYGNPFDGSAALAQIIASTFGGTGNGFTKFTGAATSEKTFTLPNASATVLTDNALVTAAQGGTANGFFAVSGPATSTKTFTFPNASATVLTDNALVTAAQGGTANGFFAVSGPASTTKTFTFPNASATVLTDNAVVTGAQGGTGVNNSGKTITLANNVTTSGNFALTLTQTATTNVTLPTTGTLSTLAGSETFTNKTLTTPIITSITNTGTLTLPTVTGTIPEYAEAAIASSSTPGPTGDSRDNFLDITALAAAPTFAAPSGTPANHNNLVIRIKDNATARALTWNAIYRGSTDFALPSTTVISKTMYVQFLYNSTDSKWDCVGLTNGF